MLPAFSRGLPRSVQSRRGGRHPSNAPVTALLRHHRCCSASAGDAGLGAGWGCTHCARSAGVRRSVAKIGSHAQGVYRGLGDTRTPLWGTLACNAINLVLCPVFIFGLGWGVGGAALSTVVAEVKNLETWLRQYFPAFLGWLGASWEALHPAQVHACHMAHGAASVSGAAPERVAGLMQGAAAAWLVYALSRRYALRLAGRAAVASLASFLGPTGAHADESYIVTHDACCSAGPHAWHGIQCEDGRGSDRSHADCSLNGLGGHGIYCADAAAV